MPRLRVDAARAGDVPALVDMVAEFRAEVAAVSSVPFDAGHTADLLGGLIASPSGFVGVVRNRATAPVGCLVAAVGDYPFAPVAAADELIFYIAPEWRGGRAALDLLASYEAWAVSVGAVVMGLTYTGKACGALYRRAGFVPVEHKFIKMVGE